MEAWFSPDTLCILPCGGVFYGVIIRASLDSYTVTNGKQQLYTVEKRWGLGYMAQIYSHGAMWRNTLAGADGKRNDSLQRLQSVKLVYCQVAVKPVYVSPVCNFYVITVCT